MPKASIICSSYNHEKYVKFFIDSVLNQTEQDFELIIVDDCSSDNTVNEIKQFNDNRVKLIQHEYNQGCNAGLNDAINAATSDIICFAASDDMFCENYLEEVLNIFEKNNVNAIFVSLNVYDDKNNKLDLKNVLEKRPKHEILKHAFLDGNQLISPGLAVKRDALNKFIPLPVGLIQFQDYDMMNKVTLNNEIFLSDKCLVKYRRSDNSLTLNDKKDAREYAESDIIMDYFLSIKDSDLFKKIFKGVYEQFGEPTVETIPYFLGRIALTSTVYVRKLWGYKTIIKFVSCGENLSLLNKLYNIKFSDLFNLCPVDTLTVDVRKKYKKYKKLFNIFLILFIVVNVIFISFLIIIFM